MSAHCAYYVKYASALIYAQAIAYDNIVGCLIRLWCNVSHVKEASWLRALFRTNKTF